MSILSNGDDWDKVYRRFMALSPSERDAAQYTYAKMCHDPVNEYSPNHELLALAIEVSTNRIEGGGASPIAKAANEYEETFRAEEIMDELS